MKKTLSTLLCKDRITSFWDVLNSSMFLFVTGIVLFSFIAVLGWKKLQFGFNFIDEGMYMTDAWRMAAGDKLFPDNATNAAFLYTLFNEFIFRIDPEITLLGFRKLQYFTAIYSMSLLAVSVYRWTREAWYLPYVLTLFAFTGFDVNGMTSNFSYYVYPHMFITLHVAFLLFALMMRQGAAKDCLLLLSGICLWGIGFSLLPLTLTLTIPLVLFFLFRFLFPVEERLAVRSIMILYLPAAVAWLIFFAIHGRAFLEAAFKIYRYAQEGGMGVQTLVFSRNGVPYILTGLLLVTSLIVVGVRRSTVLAGISVSISAIIFFAVRTNLWDVVPPFWRGWFNQQMWFSSLVIATWVIVIGFICIQYKKKRLLGDSEKVMLILIVPSIIMAGAFVYFSTLHLLTVQLASLPTILALSILVTKLMHGLRRIRILTMLVLLLGPFYYGIVHADWNFTYFDLPPSELKYTFKEGFTKGIRTNHLYVSVGDWMTRMAEKYSQEGDYAIVTDKAPMGYMLIKRRPALNHSWGGLLQSRSLRSDAVKQMKRDKREPEIAFRFIKHPAFLPDSGSKNSKYQLGLRDEINISDPIDNYLVNNMRLVDRYVFMQEEWVKVYVRRSEIR